MASPAPEAGVDFGDRFATLGHEDGFTAAPHLLHLGYRQPFGFEHQQQPDDDEDRATDQMRPS